MNRFATGIILITVISLGLGAFVPAANAYSLYPPADTSSSINLNMNFDNFNVASGLDQLAVPFRTFVASVQNVQSDTINFADVAPAANIIQSKTMPFMNATMQNYLNQASDWFYGIVGSGVSNFAAWLKENL